MNKVTIYSIIAASLLVTMSTMWMVSRQIPVYAPPTLNVLSTVSVTNESSNYVPTVLMHGMGDSGSNSGMRSLAQSIMTKYPGSYAVAVDVFDGLSSYYTQMDKQVAKFAEVVRADPKLAKGFNAAGLSQGALVVRAYVSLYNDPPVLNLVSICGTINGIATCPSSLPSFLCSMYAHVAYSSPLVFASYWKDPTDKAAYLSKNKFLPMVNNELDTKNTTMSDNMKALNKLVFITASQDTMVIPKESESMGFIPWGSPISAAAQKLRDTEAYNGDWLGLKTLDAQKKIDELSFDGDHLQFSDSFWNSSILPYFGNTFP